MARPPQETDELRFWRRDFGDGYRERNPSSDAQLRARVALWARILSAVAGAPPGCILEVGANIGNNLRALRALSAAELFAVEPNDAARKILIEDGVVPEANVRSGFAAEIDLPTASVDLVFTSGVLIHVHPDDLPASCAEMHRISRRYLCAIEYFADRPEEIEYRGHAGRLWKRDFGGFWLDAHPDLRVVDYGFAWRRVTGLDNLTWWLLEKTPPGRS